MSTVRVDLTQVLRMLDGAEKQIPYAAARGLNAIADRIVVKEKVEIRDVFDRPTPATQNSVAVFQRASKSNPVAIVGVKNQKLGKGNAPADWLAAEVFGGSRKQKGMERAIQAKTDEWGTIWVAPSTGLENQYGNLSVGEVQKLLAGLGVGLYTQTTKGSRRVRSLASRGVRYFIGRPQGSNLPAGVWMTQGRTIKPIVIFIDQPDYQPARFDFFYVAQHEAERAAPEEFIKAAENALATAK
jgi:hypothetical protein